MSNFNKAIEALEKATATALLEFKKESKKLEDAVAAVTGAKILEVTPCKITGPCGYTDIEQAAKNKSSGWCHTTPHWSTCIKEAREALTAERARIDAIHLANGIAIENNKKTASQITTLMESIGIPARYSAYELKSARSRTKEWVSKSAGFTEDIRRVCIMEDGYTWAVSALNEYEKRINKYEVLNKEKEEKELKEKERKAKEREHLMNLAKLAAKYDTEIDLDEVLDAILEKNKYLRLGHFLLENRNDWNEGFDYAQRGLNSFIVESEEDEKIYECISGLIESWDNDGRVFRDCEYGYDFLFSKAPDELYEDYFKVRNYRS